MSHFTVAVFHKDGEKTVDELLAPFNENLEMDRYVAYTKKELIEKGRKEIEEYKDKVYDEYLKDKEAYKKNCRNKQHIEYLEKEFPKHLTWTDEEVYQDQIECYDEDYIGENGEVYSTYNPNSRWDWYEIGGRWSGLLKLKPSATSGSYGKRSWTNQKQIIPENRVDSAKIKDIDFSIDKKQYAKLIRFWELKVEGDVPEDEKEKKLLEYDFYKKEYYTDKYKNKEEYAAIESSFSTYAVITPDGEWHSKGEMGWFGCSSETDAEAKKWTESFKEAFIDKVDPDLNLTIVDCHI